MGNSSSKSHKEGKSSPTTHGPFTESHLVEKEPATEKQAAQSDSGRYNYSNRGALKPSQLNNPFAQGAFRMVAKARYTVGERKGQPCATKWFKTGAVYSSDFWELDIKAVHKALEIINLFNDSKMVNVAVKLNMPTVWRFGSTWGQQWRDQRVLVEPFIEGYQKFNSNTGWTDESKPWSKVMQALSHFSYHITGGEYLICDLQGGAYLQEAVLTDPVILSQTREFGVTDLGPDGISTFFSQHVCNKFCRKDWIAPANPVRYFDPVSGTSMRNHRTTVATMYSHPPPPYAP
ncbi:kinase-like domain-containing protein [Triangularia verruculosa]|uniref:Kinase-like domain-containing protein n=1 Tax=Triangularia verruculosa TaxID=2587418 RepID=A0AAN7ARC6_9PEZI|nr:kinase-like domain-containing protein [Triangularia verruculosa]